LLIASPTFFRTFFRASGAVSIRLRPPLLMTDRPAGPHLFGQRVADLLDLIWVEVMVQDLERSTVPNACHASFLSCGSVFIISSNHVFVGWIVLSNTSRPVVFMIPSFCHTVLLSKIAGRTTSFASIGSRLLSD
jgi:hypothetical protein